MVVTALHSVTMVFWKETDRQYSFMESHGQALEQECCFPVVFYHCGDSPVYLLYQLYGQSKPCIGCLNGNRVENICAGQPCVIIIIINNENISDTTRERCRGTLQ